MQKVQEVRREAVARITKSFGLSGELLIHLFDTFPAKFDTKEPLFVVIDKLAVPLFCDRFERRGRSGALVVFSDFYSERRTAELIGCELYREEMKVETGVVAALDPDADELFPEDLVGFRVVVDETLEGVIDEFVDGENPLFLVTLAGRQVYIPVADEFITEIDTDMSLIRFELPEGLVDLND